MARGVNKAILIGNLGADPEVRYTTNGSAVANLRLATSDQWRDKNTGEQQERTEWHRVTFFGKRAEVAGEYLNKGSKVYVEGRLQTDKWQDQNGVERFTTKIIGNELQMLDGYGGGSGGSSSQNPPTEPSGGGAGPPDDFDDDIPFAGAHWIDGG